MRGFTLQRLKFTVMMEQLVRNTHGTAAILFALTFFGGTCAALLAIDLARASQIRGELQDALDAATLAAAVSRTNDAKEIEKIGDAFIAAHFNPAGLAGGDATFKATANSVRAIATVEVQPFFADIVIKGGVIPLKVEAEVLRDFDSADTELVLVLDTTNSMSGQKISALKAAAKSLVTKVTAGNSKISVGVIPFGQYVNVGVHRRSQPWIKVAADSSTTTTTTTNAGCKDIKSNTTCTTPAKPYSCVVGYDDGVPKNGTCWTPASGCSTTYYNPPYPQQCWPASTSTSTASQKFHGCVGSPAYPMNVRDADASRVYPGMMNVTCTSELTPLTPSKSKVIAAIDALKTSGETYLPSGLAWGFNAISPVQPLTEAKAYDASGKNAKPRKVLVLMTDGQNTRQMNAGTGAHNVAATPATQADAYTTELCTNIKAAKIEVFTIAFEVTNTPTKTLLSSCASGADHFFDASNTAALNAAFDAIANSLQVIRIAR